MEEDQKRLRCADGGIIPQAQWEEQSGAVSLLIGLGGTGTSCLQTIRDAVCESLSSDDPEQERLKFIIADSD